MTQSFSQLPEFPNPPAFPATLAGPQLLADFLHDLFESGIASVVDPIPLPAGQNWRGWAQRTLIESAPPPEADAKPRPNLRKMLEQAHRRLLLELPAAPGVKTEPLPFDPLVALEAARRLYQVCQVLAVPQQDKAELRRSFSGDFRPANFAALLSAYSAWTYLPMALDHVRQRLTVASGATAAMQEVELIIREQLAVWPLPLRAVLLMDLTPDPVSLELLNIHPVGARYLAEQVLQTAMTTSNAKLAGWLPDHALHALINLLGNLRADQLRGPWLEALGDKKEAVLKGLAPVLAEDENAAPPPGSLPPPGA